MCTNTENVTMILKMPSGGANAHNDSFYDIDNDDIDANEVDSSFDDDFSEYLWMENEEEFDSEEMKRLEEEALMEQCIEAMREDEIEEEFEREIESQGLCHVMATLQLQVASTETSNLNPLAKEFVPSLPTPSST
ncbi:Polyadenylate-binding protein-interacting protein 2B [Pseudolycoriella hygida]|uniref:Polyadenylate-binding protein-interacting protein 2B n=1 Tax=Pseudolycoriella hygida TaxID=35572 RepID=A0A9Q0MV84_9DIPT|nr:Polyadenylate-binding protein-interacting protein 2B [Pseudolycoriella hygida]